MTNNHFTSYSNCHSQSGAALVIGLVMLTIITLLSVSAMRSTNLDTKIAVNHQFKEMSFQAAENALARVTGPLEDADLDLPNALGAVNAVTNFDYYESTGVDHQPDFSADVELEMTEISRRYKFSGFPLNVLTVMYQADSRGTVAGTDTQTINRMQVALIRN
jgi:type IV pilus assembly protein PilX